MKARTKNNVIAESMAAVFSRSRMVFPLCGWMIAGYFGIRAIDYLLKSLTWLISVFKSFNFST